MASLNKVFIIGNLTRDPELKYLTSGTAVCNFSVAIGRKYKTKDGEMKDEVVYVNNITAWARLAEICGEYLQKGAPVHIEGRLHLNAGEDKESGKKMSQLRVTAEKIQFLGRKGDGTQPKKEEEVAGAGQGAPPEESKSPASESAEPGEGEIPF